MVKYILSAGLLLLACACASNTGGSAYTETGAICDNAGLESQLVSLRDQSQSTSAALGLGNGDGGGAGGFQRNSTDVTRAYQLRDKLRRFDAQVDVQYRSMTASCKAYARCMEMRRYREGDCRSSMDRWQSAEREFSTLTRELREIDAEVQKFLIVSRRSGCRGNGCAPRLNTQESCDCSNSVGGVFANCCYSDRRR